MLKTILGLPATQASTTVIAALFAYYFERINQRQFIKYVGDDAEGRRIKDIARRNGYILKNCKLYAYAVHYARQKSLPAPRCADYGVTRKDASILRRLNLRHIKRLPKAYTLKEYDALIAKIILSKELKDYIGKFVHKKMKFLIQSYGDNYTDICGYLHEVALNAVYIKYPFYESELHILNIGRSNAHNKGHSYISSATAKSRQRLQVNEEGNFESVLVDMSTLADLEAPPNYGQELREGLMALATIEAKLPLRTQEFLLAASGQHHPGFSSFLGVNNEDAADHMDYEKYLSHLRDYLSVTEKNMEKLFVNIRNYMNRCNYGTHISAAQ